MENIPNTIEIPFYFLEKENGEIVADIEEMKKVLQDEVEGIVAEVNKK